MLRLVEPAAGSFLFESRDLGALELGTLLSGAVLTEHVFTILGLRQADRRRGLQP